MDQFDNPEALAQPETGPEKKSRNKLIASAIAAAALAGGLLAAGALSSGVAVAQTGPDSPAPADTDKHDCFDKEKGEATDSSVQV